jgi:hypothetical protein
LEIPFVLFIREPNMGENRREAFLKRLSTVGFGAREAMEVMLSDIVHDVREQVVQKRFREEEMEKVAEFHDHAEDLWRDVVKTDPPISAAVLTKRMRELLLLCVGPLGQYERRIQHGVRAAEEFEKAH